MPKERIPPLQEIRPCLLNTNWSNSPSAAAVPSPLRSCIGTASPGEADRRDMQNRPLLAPNGGLVLRRHSSSGRFPSDSPPLQLLIIGIAGPQLIQTAAQSRTRTGSKDEAYLASDATIVQFLGSESARQHKKGGMP